MPGASHCTHTELPLAEAPAIPAPLRQGQTGLPASPCHQPGAQVLTCRLLTKNITGNDLRGAVSWGRGHSAAGRAAASDTSFPYQHCFVSWLLCLCSGRLPIAWEPQQQMAPATHVGEPSQVSNVSLARPQPVQSLGKGTCGWKMFLSVFHSL